MDWRVVCVPKMINAAGVILVIVQIKNGVRIENALWRTIMNIVMIVHKIVIKD